MAAVGALGALSAEELEMVRFMRASKAAAAQDGSGAAAGGAAELSTMATVPAGDGGAAPAADGAAQAEQRSNPSSPVDEPPGAGGGAPGNASGDGLSDDALLAFDVDAAVAAAGGSDGAAAEAAVAEEEEAAPGAEEEDEGDLLEDDDFMAELLSEVGDVGEPPPADDGRPAQATVTFAPPDPQPQPQPRPAAGARPAAARPASSSAFAAAAGGGGILRRPAAPPAAPAAAPAPGDREDVESSSRLRLQPGRALNCVQMRALTAAHPYLSFRAVQTRVHDDASGAVALSEQPWLTIGVVTKKSDKKPTKNGSHFRTLYFTDMQLEGGRSICVLLTGEACSSVRVQEGGVYSLLEPEIQQERRKGGTGFILIVSRSESIHFVGRSRDFVPCRALKKDNQPCSNYVDRRLNDLCPCHAEQAYNALKTDKTGRMDLNNAALSISRQIHERREDSTRIRTHGAGRGTIASRKPGPGLSGVSWQPRVGEKQLSAVGGVFGTYEVAGTLVRPVPREGGQSSVGLSQKNVLRSQERLGQMHAAGQLTGYRRGPQMVEAAKKERARKEREKANARKLAAERKKGRVAAAARTGISQKVNARLERREEKVFGCGGNHGEGARVRIAQTKANAKKRARSTGEPETGGGGSAYSDTRLDDAKKYTNGTEAAGAIGRSAAARWSANQAAKVSKNAQPPAKISKNAQMRPSAPALEAEDDEDGEEDEEFELELDGD